MSKWNNYLGKNEVKVPPCHEGVRHVLDVKNIHVYAGKADEVAEFNDWSLMVILEDRHTFLSKVDTKPVVAANPEAALLLPKELILVPTFPTLTITWPDYGVPLIGAAWWKSLVAFLSTLPEGDMGVGCWGGHGRTGTFLSTLMGLVDTKIANPIKEVRETYCAKCVESEKQIEYIKRMTGKEFSEKPSSWYTKVTPVTTEVSGNSHVQINDLKSMVNEAAMDDGVWEKDDKGNWWPKNDPYWDYSGGY